jgi:alpha-mannosidase
MLDSILVVRGEQRRTFRFGIGIDLKQPLHDALGLLTPEMICYQQALPTSPHNSGWLFHVDARNVIATAWEPLNTETGALGFRVRLIESAGRSVTATLSAFRPIQSARRVDFLGQDAAECTLDEGRVQLQFDAHQWIELEAVF